MTSDGPRMENSTEAEAQRDPQDAGEDERDEGKAERPAVSGCPGPSRSEDEDQSEGQEAGPEDHEGSDPYHPVALRKGGLFAVDRLADVLIASLTKVTPIPGAPDHRPRPSSPELETTGGALPPHGHRDAPRDAQRCPPTCNTL